jgi:hypothetical protein
MNTCKHCGTSDSIVYSGTDALLLECLDAIENICYDCANEQRKIRQEG